MPAITIRRFQAGDDVPLAQLLTRVFAPMERWTPERVAGLATESESHPAAFWMALDGSRHAGCLRVSGLARTQGYVMRELAADADPAGPIIDGLLDVGLGHLDRLGATYVRASTPILPPYPDAYRGRGFVPVRRALTLVWDLTRSRWSPAASSAALVRGGNDYPPELLAQLYVEGMRPYWDWWIDERGGAEAYTRRVAASFASAHAEGELWLVGELSGSPVGLVGATELGQEEAGLQGVYVLPAYRGQGVGPVLLQAAMDRVRHRSARLVVDETITSLEADIPSVRLYRRSGAWQRAEYLHLQREEARSEPRFGGSAPP